MKRVGIILNEKLQLVVKPFLQNGMIIQGLAVGASDDQNIQIILASSQGSIREHPLIGLGLINYKNSQGREKDIVRAAKVQLALDGYVNNDIQFVGNNLSIQ